MVILEYERIHTSYNSINSCQSSCPISIKDFRPSLSTVNIPIKVNARLTLPVITILKSVSDTLYPAFENTS